jgi:hypothetical protein
MDIEEGVMKRSGFLLVCSVILLAVVNCGGGGGGGGTTTPPDVTVTGTVLDSRNNPVPFATVTVNSTPFTTKTDMNGQFQADVEEGGHQLIAVKSGVSFLDTPISVSSGGGDLGSFPPTKAGGYWPWYEDGDSDTYGNASSVMDTQTSQAPAYTTDYTDCDDAETTVNPGASEVCNDVDDNCSGDPDDGLTFTTYYRDADSDNYGTTSTTESTCLGAPSSGYVADSTDCDDGDIAVNPGASEVCDGDDNDCDGSTLDGAEEAWYNDPCDGTDADLCQEGSYECTGGVQACSDTTGDNLDICNDNDDDCNVATIDGADETWLGTVCDGPDSDQCNEGSYECTSGVQTCSDNTGDNIEICDGTDNDCDGTIDNGQDLSTFYADLDGDNFGNAAVATSACQAPTGFVSDNTDCNDDLASVFPGATEICNGEDEDCDTVADNDLTTSTHYRDFDEDGYGNPGSTQELCGPLNGFVADSTDCDDNDVTRFPGAPEVCDGQDNDCDGSADEDPPTLYADTDGDGFGSAGATTVACTATGYVYFPGDCDDSNSGYNPLAEEICGDDLDQDCSGADIACPSYPFTASTVTTLAQGDWWSYAVTGNDTGTLTKYISIGTVTSPESGEDCLAMVNGFDLTTVGSFSTVSYLAQDTDGTLRVCGLWDSGEVSPDWIAGSSGGSYTNYPSPLSVGQAGGSAFSFDTTGAEGAYTYTVDSIESIQTPAGIFSTYKIWTTYYEFWPGATAAEDEEYYEFNVSWFSPDYGEVMFDTQFLSFTGTSATPDYDVYLRETLTNSRDLDPGCGDAGPGTGQLASLAGTWVGTGNDHFVSAGVNWLDYEVSVSVDGSGNITEIMLNSTASSVTGIITAVDDNFYTIEFDDVATGQLLVDDTFTYMVFIRNIGFNTGDMFFSVLQKGAGGAAPVYPKFSPVGLFSGFGYDYCTQTDEFYRFAPAALFPEPESSGSLGMPVKGIGPSGSFDANLLLWQPQFGWWNGFDTAGGDLHLFLSPDGLFAGAYHQVRGILYIWPSDFAFYALSR